jgi:hypothetical protein
MQITPNSNNPDLKMKYRVITALTFVLVSAAIEERAMSATVSNGSFESGLNGWTFVDLTPPFQPLSVQSAGDFTNFGNAVIPSDGSSAISHGFDGNGIELPHPK